MNTHHDIPNPEDISIEDREDAMSGYLMMFASIGAGIPLPVINLIAGIIYFYISRNKSPFVRFHATQAVLSQLPTSLLNAGLIFWLIRIFFFDYELNDYFKIYAVIVGFLNISYFGFSIWAAVQARKGRMYYFLFIGKFSLGYAFKNRG